MSDTKYLTFASAMEYLAHGTPIMVLYPGTGYWTKLCGTEIIYSSEIYKLTLSTFMTEDEYRRHIDEVNNGL